MEMRMGFIEAIDFNSSVFNVSPQMPFIAEKNMQGLSVHVGFEYYFSQLGIGIRYIPNLRYDYIHGNTDFANSRPTGSGNAFIAPEQPDTKEIIIDHSFQILRYFNKRKDKILPPYYGFGLTLVNTGKDFYYKEGSFEYDGITYVGIEDPIYYNIEFTTYDLFVAFPFKKLFYISPNIHYIPSGHPTNPRKRFMSFGIKVHYNWGI